MTNKTIIDARTGEPVTRETVAERFEQPDPYYTLEVRIIKQLITDALAYGYTLGVQDGEEVVMERSTDADALLAAMFSTDEDYLLAYKADGTYFGWVHLVHGNGWCVISNYTTNLEHIMERANKIADEGETAEAAEQGA